MKATVAVLPGDGVGPEVMQEAVKLFDVLSSEYGHDFELEYGLVGGAAYDRYKTHMPEETLKMCERSDAILFGSVGGPVAELDRQKWKDCERNSILALRKHFGFSINMRPSKVYSQLSVLCPLKPELVRNGIDLLIVRELVGDAYFGARRTGEENGERFATDESKYTESQIKTAAHAAFKSAKKRKNKVTSVDKANVLTTSKLWREVVREVRNGYPDVIYEDMLVDNCAMQLLRNPSQFDVIVTSNMFGDILSDQAAALPGSLGLVASASLNKDNFGLYEPPGGSAQDIAGKGVANPIAQMLSVAMMLKYSFGLTEESDAIEQAVEKSLSAGLRTVDIYSSGSTERLCNTEMISESIFKNFKALVDSTVSLKSTVMV